MSEARFCNQVSSNAAKNKSDAIDCFTVWIVLDREIELVRRENELMTRELRIIWPKARELEIRGSLQIKGQTEEETNRGKNKT